MEKLDDKIIIKPLGAGNEVGRSCIHIKYKNKQLLLDCGVHPAATGIASLPFLDLVDLEQIDAVLITHFHLDHAAALPFLTERTKFKGKVFMTHPTRAILKWLLMDYLRVVNSSTDDDVFSESDFYSCYNKITPIDYHQDICVSGIHFTALNAGHVLGAAMFLIQIEETKILYTGDFSREDDRHLRAAESPNCKLDILITESTYGTQCHLPRIERERRFIKVVTDVVERGGKCLLPVFALGRAQELLLILEEHWSENPQLNKIPIYYSSVLAKKCMTVYQTYMNMMNKRIQEISLVKNPFDFKHVKNLQDNQRLFDFGPCIIMTSPGMLQCGLSRELFEKWCGNQRNGVIITGYCVDGTLAKEILKEPKEIISCRGNTLRLNMTVEYISFSAHVDYIQNVQFIEECNPDFLLFVHGEINEMLRLKSTIAAQNEKKGVKMDLFALKNGEELTLPVSKYNKAKVFTDKNSFIGMILKSDRDVVIYDVDDIVDKKIECDYEIIDFKQECRIPYEASWNFIKDILVAHYGATTSTIDKSCSDSFSDEILVINGLIIKNNDKEVILEWEGNYCNDVLAMAIEKTIVEFNTGIRTLRWNYTTERETLFDRMKNYFNTIEFRNEQIIIENGAAIIKGDIVYCDDEKLKERVLRIYTKIKSLINPLHSHQ